MNYLKTMSVNIGEVIRNNQGKVISRQDEVYYTTIAKLEALGFEGCDVSLEISLLEYGMAWARDGDDWHFIYQRHSVFECGSFLADTDWRKEFNWMSEDDVHTFLGYMCMDDEEFDASPLPYQIQNVTNYWGHANVFGEGYGGGFCIFADGRNRVREYLDIKEYEELL